MDNYALIYPQNKAFVEGHKRLIFNDTVNYGVLMFIVSMVLCGVGFIVSISLMAKLELPSEFIVIGSLLFGILAIGFVYLRRYQVNKRRLEQDGVIIAGTLESVSERYSQRVRTWHITYRFQPPQSTEIQHGKFTTIMPPPEIGSTLAILYVDEELHQPL